MRIPLGDVTASVVPDLATFPRTMPPDCSVTSSQEPTDGAKSARARAVPQSAVDLHSDMGPNLLLEQARCEQTANEGKFLADCIRTKASFARSRGVSC